MAGYSDTRQLIIDTLMGRPAGTEIQPEDHQAFALALNDYIRSVELVAGSGVPVDFAEPNTVPVQPDNGQAVYLSYVPRSTTKNFVNFINQSGNSISVTSSSGEVKLVTLLWNGSYWSSQIVTINVLSDDSNVNTSNIGASDYTLFSTSSNYSTGDIVRYDGKLYKFTADHATGDWLGTDVELASINSILTDKVQKKDWFYYIYGDDTAFTNNSVYIQTLGLFKKNNTAWQNIEINDTFICNMNENIVLQKDGTISIKVSNYVSSSDVVLLTHSVEYNDWIGGELFEQYLHNRLIKDEEVLFNINTFPTVYSVTGAVFTNDSIKFNTGKVWWVGGKYTSWQSTDFITQEFNLRTSLPEGISVGFLVLSLDNVVSFKTIYQLISSDVILLQYDNIYGSFIGGVLYPFYLRSYVDKFISSNKWFTATYSVSGMEFNKHSVIATEGKLWWIFPGQSIWNSTEEITGNFDFSTIVTTAFLVLDVEDRLIKVRESGNNLLSSDVILLQHEYNKGFTSGYLYEKILDSENRILNDKIGELEEAVKVSSFEPFNVISKKYINKEGVVTDTSSSLVFYTKPIRLKQGETIYCTCTGSNCAILSLYDNDTYTPIAIIPSGLNQTISTSYTANADCEVVLSGVDDGSFDYSIKSEVSQAIEELEEKIDGYKSIKITELIPNAGSITNATGIFSSRAGMHTCIPVSLGDKLKIKSQDDLPFVYTFLTSNVLVDEQLAPFSNTTPSTNIIPANSTIEVTVPADAKYLYLIYSASDYINYLPSEILLEKCVLVSYSQQNATDEQKATARNNIGAISLADIPSFEEGGVIKLKYGYYDSLLNYVSDSKHLSTTPINGGKCFVVNTEYCIHSAVLLNMNGEVINAANDFLLDPNVSFNFPASSDRHIWGINNLPDGYKMVVSFSRIDGNDITLDEDIILNIYDVKSKNLIPIFRDDFYVAPNLYRSNQVQRVVLKTQANMPIITNYYTNAYKTIPAGGTMVGLPYSSVKELDKLIPFNVSFKTFMTALHNKRSLLYTEIVSDAHSRSSYGFTYHGVGCASYYGIACNWFTAYVLGLLIPTNSFETIGVSGMSLVYNSNSEEEFDIQNLQPLDILYRSGHISIVSNIYRDPYGKNILIEWSEANIPNSRTSLYTKEAFLDRIHHGDYDHLEENGYKIYRYSFPNNGDWDNTYIQSEFVQGNDSEYINGFTYNDNICTFAGDEAKFIEGDKVVLNINRGNYTQCQIYKDNALLNTIALSNDEEIDLDLSSYDLTDGSYKACLTDGTNTSKYTYWEIYNLDLSINSSKVASFSSTRLTPFYFEFQGIAGTFTARSLISSSEIESGQKTFTREFSASLYLKLFAKTPDGYVVTKRIVYNA